MNAAKTTRTFLSSPRGAKYSPDEGEWIKAVFALIFKVAKRHRRFTVDDIWAEIDRTRSAGKMPKASPDHRVLGPMILHMAAEGLLGSTGYFAKSTRRGGGSRPVTIWESRLAARAAA